MSTFSTPSKICAIGDTYYDVSGTAIPAAPVTSPTLVTPNIGVATATSINGMPFTSAATAYTIATRDTSANTAANAFVPRAKTVATAGSTTTLVVTSEQVQIFTGSTTQTLVLPDATTLMSSHCYRVINKSSGAITVNANGGGLLGTVLASTSSDFIVTNISTSAGTWTVDSPPAGATLSAIQTFTEVNTFNKGTAATSSATGTVVVSGGIGVSGSIVGGTGSTVSIGSNASAAASSMLDLTSTSAGILIPRMTTAQRNAISSPAVGLMVYDTDLNSYQVYKAFSTTGKIQNSNTNDATFTASAFWQSVLTGQTEVVALVSLNNSTNWSALTSGAVTFAIVGDNRCIYNNDFASSTVGKGLNYASPTTFGIGVYRLVLGFFHATDRAILDVAIKINGSGSYTTIQSAFDCYSSVNSGMNLCTLERYFAVTTSGSFDIKFTANGKNASSTSYGVLVGGFMVYKLG